MGNKLETQSMKVSYLFIVLSILLFASANSSISSTIKNEWKKVKNASSKLISRTEKKWRKVESSVQTAFNNALHSNAASQIKTLWKILRRKEKLKSSRILRLNSKSLKQLLRKK